jgi:hypothetical protein
MPVSRVIGSANAFLFPGYLPIALSLIAVGAWLSGRLSATHRHYTICYSWLGLLTILLIVGPPLSLWPLVYWLPGFNFIRVPSRFIILTVLALSVLAAIGFEWLRGRLPARAQRWALPVTAALLLCEFAVMPLGVTDFSLRPAAAERWLADQPGPFVVAELPNAGAPREQSIYMLHSMAHWQKTVHGFSGIDPPQHYAMYIALQRFPDADTTARLRAFGVTFVVVHVDRYAPDRWPRVDQALARSADLELVFQEPRSRVYRLRYDPPTSTTPARSR